VTYDLADVILRNGVYMMWVRSAANKSEGIYRATSYDGANWTVFPSSPVLTPGPNGTWDDSQVFYPDVVWNGSMYLMYYVGNGNISAFPNSVRVIGVAFSHDGVSWVKYGGNPIIKHGPGQYDARWTRSPSVVKDGNTYKMWYSGTSNFTSPNPVTPTIAYATSPDGVHWTKYPGNPVFQGFTFANPPPGSGTYNAALGPSVVQLNGTFLMAFDDGGSTIGYATSFDGVTWSFSNARSILLGLASWHDAVTFHASLVARGASIQMWYTGSSNQASRTAVGVGGIGFATCSFLLLPHVTTSTTTIYSTTTGTVTSTSISVQTNTITSVSTSVTTTTQVASFQGPPATIAALGAVVAAVSLAGLLAMRLASRRPPAPR
jgi:hypothetical protein